MRKFVYRSSTKKIDRLASSSDVEFRPLTGTATLLGRQRQRDPRPQRQRRRRERVRCRPYVREEQRSKRSDEDVGGKEPRNEKTKSRFTALSVPDLGTAGNAPFLDLNVHSLNLTHPITISLACAGSDPASAKTNEKMRLCDQHAQSAVVPERTLASKAHDAQSSSSSNLLFPPPLEEDGAVGVGADVGLLGTRDAAS